jgi:hypothetical protein
MRRRHCRPAELPVRDLDWRRARRLLDVRRLTEELGLETLNGLGRCHPTVGGSAPAASWGVEVDTPGRRKKSLAVVGYSIQRLSHDRNYTSETTTIHH